MRKPCPCAGCIKKREIVALHESDHSDSVTARNRLWYREHADGERERLRRRSLSRDKRHVHRDRKKAQDKRYRLLIAGIITRPSMCEVCGSVGYSGQRGSTIVTMYDSYELDRVESLPWMCWRCRNQATIDRNRLSSGLRPHGISIEKQAGNEVGK